VHKANYLVPVNLATGEQQLLAKVAAGGDLWPHQSRKIENAVVEDGMLNDYGIQHFHLGTMHDPRHPSLIQGTKELLFAVVKDNDFYAIGVFDHKAWSKQGLLDIIQMNWQQLIKPHNLKDGHRMKVVGLRHNYTDEEVEKLRKAGINAITQGADGSIHTGLGGGITANGKSLSVTRDLIAIEKHVKDLQKDVIEDLMREGAPIDTELRIEWRGDVPFAVTIPPGLEINLGGCLSFPPL
jgi:hypothetical protein